MSIEIVDLPIENGDFPVRYVKLPEGILKMVNILLVLLIYQLTIGNILYRKPLFPISIVGLEYRKQWF